MNFVKFWNDMLAEIKDIYVYCIVTGEERKIIDNEAVFGGFWLVLLILRAG